MVEVWNEYVVSLKEQLDQINETLALSKNSASDRISVLAKATEHLRILVKRSEDPAVVALYERLASVVGDLDLAVIATNKDGVCTHNNGAADRMFGSRPAQEKTKPAAIPVFFLPTRTHLVRKTNHG